MPATTMASSGTALRSDRVIDACGSWVSGAADAGFGRVFLGGVGGIEGGRERGVLVSAAGPLPSGRWDDARLQILGDVGDRLMSAGAVDAPAGIDDGPARREQQRHRSLDVVSAGSRAHDE